MQARCDRGGGKEEMFAGGAMDRKRWLTRYWKGEEGGIKATS